MRPYFLPFVSYWPKCLIFWWNLKSGRKQRWPLFGQFESGDLDFCRVTSYIFWQTIRLVAPMVMDTWSPRCQKVWFEIQNGRRSAILDRSKNLFESDLSRIPPNTTAKLQTSNSYGYRDPWWSLKCRTDRDRQTDRRTVAIAICTSTKVGCT